MQAPTQQTNVVNTSSSSDDTTPTPPIQQTNVSSTPPPPPQPQPVSTAFTYKRPKNWVDNAKQVCTDRRKGKPCPKGTRAHWREALDELAADNAPVLACVAELFGDATDAAFDFKKNTRSIRTNTEGVNGGNPSVLCQRLDTLFDRHPSFYKDVIVLEHKALHSRNLQNKVVAARNAREATEAAAAVTEPAMPPPPPPSQQQQQQQQQPVSASGSDFVNTNRDDNVPAHEGMQDNDTDDTDNDTDDEPLWSVRRKRSNAALHQLASDYDTAEDDDSDEDSEDGEESATVSAATHQKLRTKYKRLKRKYDECNHTLSFLKELFQGTYVGCSITGVPEKVPDGRKRGRC